MDDRELLELAEIGKRAVAEHAAWVARNKARKEHRDFLHSYERETGEWFAVEQAEQEDVTRHHELLKPAQDAQKKLTSARAATRRAIVRAAAEIGRALP